MKLIGPRIHGVLDYLTVVVFLVAPTVGGLTGPSAVVCYTLAGAHLVLTLLTRFPLGVRDLIPFFLHRAVEVVVGLALVIGPWVAADSFPGSSRIFFGILGVVILAVALTSHATRIREPVAE